MTSSLDRRSFIALGTAACALTLSPAILAAATHDIQMLNKDPDDKKRRMIFKPIIQVIEPGDTVTFASVNKGHNSQSIKGMIPEGVEPWKSKLSTDFSLTLEKPGFYGYRCTPHTSMGMVGLIIVKGEGMMDNLEAAKSVRQKGKSKKAWTAIWEEVDAMDLGAE